MSNNKFLYLLEKTYEEELPPTTELMMAMALIKELQSLNETLNKVIYRNNEGDWFVNTEARPSYED